MPKPKARKNGVHETTQEMSSEYLREFCTQYKIYLENKTEENLAAIHRSISMIATFSPAQFQPKELETAHFFVNLYEFVATLTDDNVLWACVSLLQNCCRRPETRYVIMNNYRFVPLLTHLFNRTQLLSDRATRLLTLLQDLTYGIQITWEEPYVTELLKVLKQTIVKATDEGDENLAKAALSVLINICYKNQAVILLFMRTVGSLSEFSRKIQRIQQNSAEKYGALASKLMIILSEDLYEPGRNELHSFIRATFANMQHCLKNWDVVQLKHMVDFLLDSESHAGLHNAMLTYTNYCEDIERMLGPLENNASMSGTKEELIGQREMCLSKVFQLISYILQLSAVKDAHGQENVISLDAIVPRIFDLVSHWLEATVCGTASVQLLDSLIQWGKTETIVPRIVRDPSIVIQLIGITFNAETPAEQSNAVLKFLHCLLQQPRTEKLILSKITESFFDKLFKSLLEAAPQTLTLEESSKAIYALNLLVSFASIAKNAYFEKCCATLQLPQIQNALALAVTTSGDEAVYRTFFQIARFEHFPRAVIAKQIAILNATSKAHLNKIKPKNDLVSTPDLNKILKTETQLFSTQAEERLIALIEDITLAKENNQLNNISTKEIMELYNYEIDRNKRQNRNMQRSLEHASIEKTENLQHINMLEAELQELRDNCFEANIIIKDLETQSQDFVLQRENFKRNCTELMKQAADRAEKLQIAEKRLSVKVSELIALQKEYTDLQEQQRAKSEQYDKLDALHKENVSKMDKLKKSINAFESEIRDKLRILEAKESEIMKLNKTLEAEKEAKKKADGLITVLEQQIQEKNAELRQYENELRETEELRKTVMSLMESKKPKRKM